MKCQGRGERRKMNEMGKIREIKVWLQRRRLRGVSFCNSGIGRDRFWLADKGQWGNILCGLSFPLLSSSLSSTSSSSNSPVPCLLLLLLLSSPCLPPPYFSFRPYPSSVCSSTSFCLPLSLLLSLPSLSFPPISLLLPLFPHQSPLPHLSPFLDLHSSLLLPSPFLLSPCFSLHSSLFSLLFFFLLSLIFIPLASSSPSFL